MRRRVLSPEERTKIIRLYEQDRLSLSVIARRFSIGLTLAWEIVNGRDNKPPRKRIHGSPNLKVSAQA